MFIENLYVLLDSDGEIVDASDESLLEFDDRAATEVVIENFSEQGFAGYELDSDRQVVGITQEEIYLIVTPPPE
jgi:hypothetical protein